MSLSPTSLPSRWELAAEAIAVKIRWFGILFGYLIVSFGAEEHRDILSAILALGVVYAGVDTAYSLRGRIFLDRFPLVIAGLESLFIGLLCYYHTGLDSPFRYYYVLSLVCCAIRHSTRVTNLTWALHSAGFVMLYVALPLERRQLPSLLLLLVLLGWVTWACSAFALLLKRVGDYLGRLNEELETHRSRLEHGIAERTRALEEAQAHVLHQGKMAAFGLLAAGIAHEVGNPLTSISSMVQMLERRDQDEYTREKLSHVSGQLLRIQTTLRELIQFSRPASAIRQRVALGDVVAEALNIAKYYKRIKGRRIESDMPADLPPVLGVRDQLVQAMLNLVLNAIDATEKGGLIRIEGRASEGGVIIAVCDDGAGIAAEDAARLFQPYFTTKPHGAGLGLVVTRKLVGEHGGSIAFESTPGVGTTFRVRLPGIENVRTPFCREPEASAGGAQARAAP